jgi:glycosyltransferase involved in cell wall biosynthesis
VIVLPPTLDWHLPLYQRPQQLARAYAEKENTLVLYLTANSAHDRVAVAEKIAPTLYLVNASLTHELARLLRGASETVLSLSWTANRRYVELLRPDRLIYEYIDELEIFDGYGEAMRRDHLYLLRRADLTVCTAQALYEKALPYARRAILSPNAGDYAHFRRSRSVPPAPEAAELAARFSRTLGYYGALAGWFDYALIASAADARPDWLFLLVGMDYDATLPKSGLLARQNVLWIPPQPYARLPSFLRLFDIALIPFVLNEITRSTSPVKLFEYMAAEKPILCSRMPECLRYESVESYSGSADFLEKAEALLKKRGDPALRAALRREALENTWAARTDELLAALEKAKSAERGEASVPARRIKKAVSD